jgi:hypothetical protein
VQQLLACLYILFAALYGCDADGTAFVCLYSAVSKEAERFT